jgi:Uma2 family endonuclease
MSHPALDVRMTIEEYLEWEANQHERHEFVDGSVVVLPDLGVAPEPDEQGSDERHVTASMNVAFTLRQHLAGTPCRTFMADMKLRPAQQGNFFYPDVMVTCAEADRADPLVKREPRLIVEVLSPSTAAYDRGNKFAHYRGIAALKEVVFIDLDSRRIDVMRRGPDGLFVLHPFERCDDVRLDIVDLTMTAEQIFAEVGEPVVGPRPPEAA